MKKRSQQRACQAKRYHVNLKGGGHATFSGPPDEKTMDALNQMVELARKKLRKKSSKND